MPATPETTKANALRNIARIKDCLRFAAMDLEALMQPGAENDELRMNFASARLPGIIQLLKTARSEGDQALHLARQLSEAERAAFITAHEHEEGFVAEAAE